MKHHRSEHFQLATLNNVLNAVAGLLLLLILYYEQGISQLAEMGTLFVPRSLCAKLGEELIFLPKAL
ncbi:hypothetical protein CF70_034455 [Cupriavidus sp. SK-3]|nr:hypothetical protein CF70_034455 [Cupriavidus sp. SK-3]